MLERIITLDYDELLELMGSNGASATLGTLGKKGSLSISFPADSLSDSRYPPRSVLTLGIVGGFDEADIDRFRMLWDASKLNRYAQLSWTDDIYRVDSITEDSDLIISIFGLGNLLGSSSRQIEDGGNQTVWHGEIGSYELFDSEAYWRLDSNLGMNRAEPLFDGALNSHLLEVRTLYSSEYSSYSHLENSWDEGMSGLSSSLRLRKTGETVWHEHLEAEVGDEIECQLSMENTSGHNLEYVETIVGLPDNSEYITNSTVLYNGLYPDGVQNLDDTICDTGIRIGYYPDGAKSVIRLRFRICNYNLVNGTNQLVVWAKVIAKEDELKLMRLTRGYVLVNR